MAPLILFAMYRRFRSNIGAQRVRVGLGWFRVGVLSLVSLLLVSLLAVKLTAGVGALVGLAIGAAVGEWGVRLTTFEQRADGPWYTPNPTLGLVISAL